MSIDSNGAAGQRKVERATDADMPLAGLTVIETASYLSGPVLGMMLADLGAEVIKVEPPRGDPLRRFGRPKGATSSYFASVNKGKRGVVLDLAEERDQRRLRALLGEADILVANWRPSAAAKFGLDDDELQQRNPRLIRCYLTGFGNDGPWSERPAFDSTIQALSGVTYAQQIDGVPKLVRSYIFDKQAAFIGSQAVLTALYRRAVDGVGQRVDMSMLDAAAYADFPDLMGGYTFVDQGPDENAQRIIGATKTVPAADGYFVISPVTVGQMRRALDAVGMADKLDELLAIPDGAEMAEAVLDTIAAGSRSKPLAEVLATFEKFDVPASPCLTPAAHLEHPQVRWNGIYEIQDWGEMGQVRTTRYPADFAGRQARHVSSPSPGLGEHSAQVFAAIDDDLGEPARP